MTDNDDRVLRQDILDGLYAKYLKDNRVEGTWRFSDCGYLGMDGYCRRKRVLKFHGIQGIVTDDQKRVFLRGHLAEGLMLESLRLKFPNICYQPFPEGIEYRMYQRPEIRFAGRTDFYVPPFLVIDGKNISVDAILDSPREGHVAQVMMTMAGLKQIFGDGFDAKGMVFYLRDGRAFDIMPFTVYYDNVLVQTLAEEVIELHDKYRVLPIKDAGTPLAQIDTDAIEGCSDPLKYPCSWYDKKRGRQACDYFTFCYPDFREPPKKRAPRKRRNN